MNKTMILAIGGAGCNIAETFVGNASVQWLKDATYVFADSDLSHITQLTDKGYKTITLHSDSDCFKLEIFDRIKKIYILAGLGGMTGSAYIGKAVESAKAVGIDDITAIVTTPFLFEGEAVIEKAVKTIESISGIRVKVFNNEALLQKYTDTDLKSAFGYFEREMLKFMESGEI